ncbi:MAG: GDSL-type esterase/lipase family protein [Thermodesulfobacteriota bacterium]
MNLLLIGDSLVEYNDWSRGLPEHRVVNAGVAGESVGGLLARLPRLLAIRLAPEAIGVMIGTNNLLMEDYAFFQEYEEILATIAATLPRAGRLVTGLPPFALPWLADSAIPRLNTALTGLAARHKAFFLDLHAAFTEAGGPASSCFEPDGVHFSAHGYARWERSLKKALATMAAHG